MAMAQSMHMENVTTKSTKRLGADSQTKLQLCTAQPAMVLSQRITAEHNTAQHLTAQPSKTTSSTCTDVQLVHDVIHVVHVMHQQVTHGCHVLHTPLVPPVWPVAIVAVHYSKADC